MKILGESFAGVATSAVRVLELYYPEEKRLFDDPFALKLLPPCWQAVVRFLYLPGWREQVLALREKSTPGVMGALLCRTCHIDDMIKKEMEGGLEQLVISGAGFDSRPYRIAGMERLRVFEADLPGAMKSKQKRIQRVLGALPPHVTYVPIDFEKQKMAEAFESAGFEKNKKTLFLLEGVTQYISAEAVDSTLEWIKSTGPESSVLFTYVRREVIDGSGAPEWFERFKKISRKIGAEWRFGIAPEELESFLSQRGYKLAGDAGAQELYEKYLKPTGRKLAMMDAERIALARVR